MGVSLSGWFGGVAVPIVVFSLSLVGVVGFGIVRSRGGCSLLFCTDYVMYST